MALLVAVYYAERLLYGTPAPWWISLAGALGALALRGAGALAAAMPAALRSLLAPAGVLVAHARARCSRSRVDTDITAIGDHVTDAGYVGALPGRRAAPLSNYLRAHQGGARYEVAAQSATQIGSLIVQDARPIADPHELQRARLHDRRRSSSA